MKPKRFIIEYANEKIRTYEKMIKEFPDNMEMYNKMIHKVDKAVWLVSRGYITNDECIRLIMYSADICEGE